MGISRWPHYVRDPKDPGATLDYQLDWSDWLADGEVIVSSEWEVSDGTAIMDSYTDDSTIVWVSGGTGGQDMVLTNTIATDSAPISRIDERSLIVSVEDR